MCAVLVAAILMGAYAASARMVSSPEQLLGTTTSTLRLPPTTATTVDLLKQLLTPPTAPPSTAKPGPNPPGAPAPAKPGAAKPTPPGPQGGEADGPAPPGPHVIPPGAQAIIDAVHRSGGNSTAGLLGALKPLLDMGYTEQQAYFLGMGHFPVAGLAAFSDDWLFPRFDGGFHFHHGCDIFATGGTPVRSPADGVLRQSSDTLGGTTDYVTQSDGTYYYMAHLSAYVPGQHSGQQVHVGDIIGFVGNSGDAVGGATHVHFEVHPGGGGPVDPKPYLDRWLAEADGAVPALIARLRGTQSPAPPASEATPAGRLAASDAFAAPAVPARSSLLWASSASPPGGAILLASAEATEAARSVDWQAEARRNELTQLAWAQGDAAARANLAPLTPAALRPVLGYGPAPTAPPPQEVVTVGPVPGMRLADPAPPTTAAARRRR